MSRFYISHETFLAIKTLPLKSGMRPLLETISNASEMSSYRFRQGEKSVRSDLEWLAISALPDCLVSAAFPQAQQGTQPETPCACYLINFPAVGSQISDQHCRDNGR